MIYGNRLITTQLSQKVGYLLIHYHGGVKGFEKNASSSDFVGMEAQVTKQTHNGAYAFVVVKGEEIGWINTQALNAFETNTVNYNAIIKKSSISIDTIPYGIPGYKKIFSSTDYLGKELSVTRETKNGHTSIFRLMESNLDGLIRKQYNGLRQKHFLIQLSLQKRVSQLTVCHGGPLVQKK